LQDYTIDTKVGNPVCRITQLAPKLVVQLGVI
jgi:hypothetical protein